MKGALVEAQRYGHFGAVDHRDVFPAVALAVAEILLLVHNASRLLTQVCPDVEAELLPSIDVSHGRED